MISHATLKDRKGKIRRLRKVSGRTFGGLADWSKKSQCLQHTKYIHVHIPLSITYSPGKFLKFSSSSSVRECLIFRNPICYFLFLRPL